MHTFCTLLYYMYKKTYLKGIFLSKQESHNTKYMESNWKFGENREIICPDGKMTKTEPKRRNVLVQGESWQICLLDGTIYRMILYL